jgi:competence protein ComEA
MFQALLAVVTFVGIIAAPQPIDAAQSNGAAASAAKPAVAVPVNINTASATDLQTLPGIGAKTAGRIIDYRQKNGRT